MSGVWDDQDATRTDALFEARDKIEDLQDRVIRQGCTNVLLAADNAQLMENADKEMGGRYARLTDALHAIEHFVWRCQSSDVRWRHELLLPLLADAMRWAEDAYLSDLMAQALRDAARYEASSATQAKPRRKP